ncbi:MAG: DNA polymerase I, partial [Nitrospinae bacterium]|nr:DNA polymerase I [Nitrospinota bacterium]
VPGIGEKTAQALIAQYGSLDDLLKRADEIAKPKLKQSLIENADLARLCKKLAQIDTRHAQEIDGESWKTPDTDSVAALYEELGFKTMLEELGKAATPKREEKRDYHAVLTLDELKTLAARLKEAKMIAVDTETTSTEPMLAELVGISLSMREGEAYYIPLAHDYEGAPEQIAKHDALKILKPLLENPHIEKCGQNVKYDLTVLANEGIALHPVSFDTMVADYLCAPEERRHNLSHIAQKYLGMRMTEYADVAGKGAKEIPFNKVEIAKAADYSAEDADAAFSLTAVLRAELKKEGLEKLFHEMEMPLVPVLAKMEQNGILLDIPLLKDYSANLENKLHKLEGEIYEAAGEEFNVASPKQLSVILFDKLKLAKVRKTKTGSSTDQAVLETLAQEHPLPALVLRHRTLTKLKSTYIDPLPEMVNPETGRIHTSFNQTTTATGRLSSSDPNLQNIPVRTEEGREIRRAFHAAPGHLLISADYSQVELRVLAHLSGDALLRESFAHDEDIHARTAREIFGGLSGEPTPEMRRAAKAVNFGIIYGQTAFGLSQELGVGRREAQGYIDSYFARYRGVREFIEGTIEKARKEKCVHTMFGRKRSLPDLGSANRTARELAERMAVNTVVQGTAADIMKKAMLAMDARLDGAKMLLQVHDELIFEVSEKGTKKAVDTIREVMETTVPLAVPLKVSVETGPNWGDLE